MSSCFFTFSKHEDMNSILLLILSLVLVYSFPEEFYFDCATENFADHADGIKLPPGWRVTAETRTPWDGGRGTGCTEDASGYTLTCQIAWFNTTTPTTFKFTYDVDTMGAEATFVDKAGTSHTITDCRHSHIDDF